VQLDAGHEIVAYTAGKMKKNRIKTLAGDRSRSKCHPTSGKGRLIFRHKDERPSTGAPAWGPRAAVSPAGGKRTFNAWQNAPIRPYRARNAGRLAGRIKKSCTSGLFLRHQSNNIVHRFSAGRH